MRIGLGMGVALALAACSPRSTPPLLPLDAYAPACAFTSIQRTRPSSGDAVPACAPPTAEQIALACRVRAARGAPEDAPLPGLEVRGADCRFTGEGERRAACRFEQKPEGARDWRAVEATFTHVYGVHIDPIVVEYSLDWRADGACGAAD